MEYIFEDVNLSGMIFSADGCKVTLEFIDMDEGKICGILECENLYVYNYHNNFDPHDNEGLACYVGEVTLSEVKKNEIDKYLTKFNYGFYVNTKTNLFKMPYDVTKLIHIEGGNVSIDIMCKEVIVKKIKID